MKVVQGKVSKIFNKTIEQDAYGNTTRLAVQINDKTWVGLGNKNKEGLAIQKGKEWIEVQEGDEVVITAEENGKYLNAKVSDVKLVSKGAPKVVEKQVANKFNQPSAKDGRQEGPKTGMLFNNAVLVVMKEQSKVTASAIVAAFRMLEIAHEECLNGVQEEVVQRPQTRDDDFDADGEIPF